MTVEEMHIMFRQIAQQMGMQTIRAILTEDIDACLNIAVNDTIKKIITDNFSITGNDQIVLYNAKVGQLNGLSTLFRRLPLSVPIKDTNRNCFVTKISDKSIMYIVGFDISYNGNKYYDGRITQAELLGRTIVDFCNRPSYDSPIVVCLNNGSDLNVEIYTGEKEPKKSTALIIAKPAVIKYEEDGNTNDSVNCDLPEYMHIDVVKVAAELYLKSIANTSN